MKRDMDLVRALLLYMEERDSTDFSMRNPSPIEHYTPQQVAEHIRLMVQSGLVTGIDASTFDGQAWLNLRLSWAGHDFIELARPEARWKKALTIATQQGFALTVDVMSHTLQKVMLGG